MLIEPWILKLHDAAKWNLLCNCVSSEINVLYTSITRYSLISCFWKYWWIIMQPNHCHYSLSRNMVAKISAEPWKASFQIATVEYMIFRCLPSYLFIASNSLAVRYQRWNWGRGSDNWGLYWCKDAWLGCNFSS